MSLRKFVGEVVKVTSASTKIGKAKAESLVRKGITIADITRRADEHSKQLGKKIGELHYGFNQEEIINKIVKKLGSMNNLVNNAGLGKFVDKAAILTVASAEIGKSLAKSLVKKGITAAARRVESVEEYPEQISNSPDSKLYGFINQEEITTTVKRIVEKLDPMNNAGLEKFVGQAALAESGKSLAESLIEKGITAVGLSRGIERLEEQFKQMINNPDSKLHDFKCDVTNQEEIITTVRKILASIKSSLVNNAELGLPSLAKTIILEIRQAKFPIQLIILCLGNIIETELMTEDLADAVVDDQKPVPDGLQPQDIVKATLFVLRILIVISVFI